MPSRTGDDDLICGIDPTRDSWLCVGGGEEPGWH